MKRIGFSILILLAFAGTLGAQTSKKKKKSNRKNVKIETKFVPPVVVKEGAVTDSVPENEVMQIATIEQEGIKEEITVAPADMTTANNTRKERIPFGRTGKFFLESAQSGTSYYDRKYGITDDKGNVILPAIFNHVTLQDDQTISVQLGRVYALYDENFKTILPFEYSSIQKVEGTGYYLVSPVSNSYTRQLFDNTGRSVLPDEYNNLSLLINAEAQPPQVKQKRYLRLYSSKTNKFGIYDMIQNKHVVPAEYDEIYDSESGLYVRKNTLMNILDTNLKPVLQKWVTLISSTGRGFFIVNDNGVFGLCNRKGEYLAKPEFSKITYIYGSVPLFILAKKDKAGIIDEKGKFIFPMEYQNIQSMQEGTLLVKKNNKWGVMNILGSEMLPAKYDTILFAYNQLLLKEKTISFYNLKSGTITSETDYTSIERTRNDETFKVSKNGKYGLLNASFSLIIPVEFEEITGMYSAESMYLVKKEGKYGFYNRRGQLVVAPKYSKLFSLSGGMGYMVKIGNKYGLLNSYGLEAAPCEYDYIGIDYNDERTFICVKGTEVKKVKLYRSN